MKKTFKHYSIVFYSSIYGEHPESWEQGLIISGTDRENAIDRFRERYDIPNISALDYFDIWEVA